MYAQTDTIQPDTSVFKVVDTAFREIKPVKQKKRDSVSLGIDSTNVYYFSGTIDSLKMGKLNTLDSGTLYFHEYDPLFKYNGIYSTLSNIGLAQKNLVFKAEETIGYYFKHQSFPRYMYTNSRVRYYHQYIPYTEVEYVIGSKKEQNFSIVFSRELWRRLSIGFDFALNFSPGPYTNSQTDDKRVFFTIQYYTKNARYGIVANYLYNKLIMEENGGITSDSIFESDGESDRRLIPVNLQSASNEVRKSGFYIEQYFNLLKPTSDTIPRKVDAGNISYSIQYERNQMLYRDNHGVSDFYTGHLPPLDSSATYDSVYQQRLRNRFRWSSIGYHDDASSHLFHIYFGIIYDIIKDEFRNYADTLISINDLTRTFNQITAFGGIGINAFKISRFNAYAEYVISETSQSDLKLTATLDQTLGTKRKNFGNIHVGIDLINRTPSWYFERFYSNYYRWANSLKKETNLVFYGEYTYRTMSAGFKFSTLGNYTYFDEDVRPQQHSKAATILQFYFNGTIPLKKFGINTRLVYQTTSASDIIRLPTFSGTLDIYFKSPVFKRAATLQTGFQFYYFSEFYADAYMPALRDFYIQNETKIGNYPYADVYVTLMIKRARLFLKYAHFNSLFSSSNYYLAPHYPARDARFAFGINWRFHD